MFAREALRAMPPAERACHRWRHEVFYLERRSEPYNRAVFTCTTLSRRECAASAVVLHAMWPHWERRAMRAILQETPDL